MPVHSIQFVVKLERNIHDARTICYVRQQHNSYTRAPPIRLLLARRRWMTGAWVVVSLQLRIPHLSSHAHAVCCGKLTEFYQERSSILLTLSFMRQQHVEVEKMLRADVLTCNKKIELVRNRVIYIYIVHFNCITGIQINSVIIF